MVVVTIAAYAWYVTTIVGQLGDRPIEDVTYIGALIGTVVGAIVLSIVLNIVIAIVVGIVAQQVPEKRDERDRDINRFGEAMGHSFVIIGATAALAMAMAKLPYFWIANVIYLCFVVSSLLSSTAKIIAYRRGLPRW